MTALAKNHLLFNTTVQMLAKEFEILKHAISDGGPINMNFLNAMDISSSGLTAQRNRMNLIAMNLSHMHTTRTPDGGPYRRKMPVFSAEPLFKGMRGRQGFENGPGTDGRGSDRRQGGHPGFQDGL